MGEYADATMKIAALPVTDTSEQALSSADGEGKRLMGLECEEVQNGDTITPSSDKCFKLVFDESKDQSLFTIDATAATGIAFFTEHVPTEFESTEHYLKDTSGVDIEPVAQVAPEGGGHSHGHGGDNFESLCVCQAKKNNWKIDCHDKPKIEDAVAYLDQTSACGQENPSEECEDKYHVMQAHHDHCLHNDLPEDIEKKLHAYEHFYDDCFVMRQFDDSLSKCPDVDCDDTAGLNAAIKTLTDGCTTI